MDTILVYVESTLKLIATYIIPIISFVFSLIAIHKANKSKATDEKLKELELIIKEFQASEIEKKMNETLEAKVEARIVKISQNDYKMKIWNSGKLEAFKVSAEIPQEYEVIVLSNKMPFEYLNPGDSFEENVVFHMGSQRKFIITTKWEDGDGNQKTFSKLSSV